MAPLCLLLFLVSLVPVTLVAAADGQGGKGCSPMVCGNLTISSPFWLASEEATEANDCRVRGFQVSCYVNNMPYLQRLQILNIFYDKASLLVADPDKLLKDFNTSGYDRCHAPMFNSSTKLGNPFSISPVNQNLIFYNCTKTLGEKVRQKSGLVETVCRNNTFVQAGGRYDDVSGHYGDYFLEGCDATVVPVLVGSGKTNASNYRELLRDGFLVTWQQPPPPLPPFELPPPADIYLSSLLLMLMKLVCFSGSKRGEMKIIRIVLMAAAASLLFPCIYVMVCHRKGQILRLLLGKNTISSTERNIEALIVSYGSLAPKRYKYSEVIKITSSLNNKLGEGGYGVVYKGRLHDGRLVAVKFLHDCKGNGEEFVNEVMSIGRTSHVNIVSLYGFCLERSKRVLIYEYMPNGSLDRYIYSDNPKEMLGWQKLYLIAIGIARGLEYLHHSCNTRIVHFDIKPQNILLDQGFCPKVADFGLAKLCHAKESKLSMTGARGTIGFIAPEVHSRAFGVVSTKSDVYSYGMMLLEMVRGRKNVKSVVEKSSQKYFPDWIYDHFGLDDGLEACEVTCEVEEIAKKMALIGLWCVQVLPMCRPTITKVLEMFERGLDELDMPPKQNFNQIPEDVVYTFNTESTSFSSHTKTQAFSEVVKTKKISAANSKSLKRLPTL
ncbi:unnamed protein product [Urochloa decumbens]|uniref:Protein kinase domain-containing protein n=1 Tax=Urochloa decumbens TaxID=240449 RepID=A0ABC8ZAR9_9POAL